LNSGGCEVSLQRFSDNDYIQRRTGDISPPSLLIVAALVGLTLLRASVLEISQIRKDVYGGARAKISHIAVWTVWCVVANEIRKNVLPKAVCAGSPISS
jgi:hypothetical protein